MLGATALVALVAALPPTSASAPGDVAPPDNQPPQVHAPSPDSRPAVRITRSISHA